MRFTVPLSFALYATLPALTALASPAALEPASEHIPTLAQVIVPVPQIKVKARFPLPPAPAPAAVAIAIQQRQISRREILARSNRPAKRQTSMAPYPDCPGTPAEGSETFATYIDAFADFDAETGAPNAVTVADQQECQALCAASEGE